MNNDTIGRRLQSAREAKGITQKELAELARCGKSTIEHYEYDLNCPRLFILADICKILGVSIDYIVYGKVDDNA
jgi:transcriptional regulator with XRE-family HTH domain